MTAQEIIIVDNIPVNDYENIVLESVKYALLSLPFTVDRMGLGYSIERVKNIAKGKIAEKLFEYFCINNNIPADFRVPSTPFYTVDKKDFILHTAEWDIKNNFLYHSDDILQKFSYTSLPALIPNRFERDQWGVRGHLHFTNSTDSKYLFTFMKGASLSNGTRGNDFLEILLTREQEQFIMDLYRKYLGLPQSSSPFDESFFWNEMSSRGSDIYFRLNFRPYLVITGFADNNYWSLFNDTGPFDRNLNFQDYYSPRWYLKTNSGAINFLSGTIWTKITNRTLPIEYLPSFSSLFPHLNQGMNYASFYD